MPGKEAHPASALAQSSIVYVDTVSPKHFPELLDPAVEAVTAAACAKAKGAWGYQYSLGVLLYDHPVQGAKRMGKVCWSTRPPRRLPDAGKPCTGQNDCVGNCMAQKQADGTWLPKCQVNMEDEVCGPVIWDGGQYHSVLCAIP